jgi:hypothetical protein
MGQHRTHGNSALPRADRHAARRPPWPVPAVLSWHGGPCPGPFRGKKGYPSALSVLLMLWRPRPAVAPPGQATPATHKPGCDAPAGLAAAPMRVCREPELEATAHRQ